MGNYEKLRVNNVITGSFIQMNVRAANILREIEHQNQNEQNFNIIINCIN